MSSSRRWLLVAAGIGAAAAVFVGLKFFAPEMATTRDEAAASTEAVTLKRGTFSGADAAHEVSGTLELWRGAQGHVLRFENYDATDGPDVKLYLSPSADGAFGDDAVRIPVPGGAGDGRATVRGNFNVPIPEGIEAEAFQSAIIWCERFGVKFGHATLRPTT